MKRPLGLVLALVPACASPPPAPPPNAPAPHGTTSPNPPAPGVDTGARRVAEMMREVEALRGLKRKREVAGKTLGRDALIAKVKAHVKEELPKEVLTGQTTLLRSLGLVPPAYDVEKGLFALLEAELAGYYEPEDKTMYLAGDLSKGSDDTTLFHELVHALQDQYWDLGPKLKHVDDGGDRTDAVHALAEGDATSAMMDFELSGSGKSVLDLPDRDLVAGMNEAIMSSKESSDVPPVLRRSLISSYADGLAFVNQLRRRGGWAAVGKAWDRPPRTTEQLLHLDKYDADEAPIAVAKPTPDAIGPGFSVLYTDLPGEQSLRLTLEEWTNPKAAARAAAGWGGDRITVLTKGAESVVVWELVFDGPKAGECVEAEEAFRELPPVRAAGTPAKAEACVERPVGPFAARKRGCRVMIVSGPSGGTCSEAAARASRLLGD